jgi:hypothetical protein
MWEEAERLEVRPSTRWNEAQPIKNVSSARIAAA